MEIDVRRLDREKLLGEHLNGLTFTTAGKQYTLGGKIGDGAIGVVRRAIEAKTNKLVAVKFLAPDWNYIDKASVEDIYRRFKREGERGSSLANKNLVEISAYEENEGSSRFDMPSEKSPASPFIIMEYVRGRTLEDYLRMERPNYPRKTVHITSQALWIAYKLTSALVYLHKHSIVHRDVKPANIFLSKTKGEEIPEHVKLGDFGIVKWGDYRASISTGTLTTTGQVGLGTLKYMAMEQSLDPQNVDFKSDMYSLGITLFELFTNHILRDIHHVVQVRDVRMEPGNVLSRLYKLGISFPPEMARHEFLLENIFDCFLKKSGRPTSSKLQSIILRNLDSLG